MIPDRRRAVRRSLLLLAAAAVFAAWPAGSGVAALAAFGLPQATVVPCTDGGPSRVGWPRPIASRFARPVWAPVPAPDEPPLPVLRARG
jgi:hypothetical protein